MRWLLRALLPLGGTVLFAAGPAAAGEAATLTVGQVTLERCAAAARWCAVLQRPLDPHGVVAGNIGVYFEYYPHSAAGAGAGMLVATEGGPGYPATESREDYLALFQPLRERYDVLIADNRGTGRSGAIDCPQLQQAPQLTEADIGDCGRLLGPRAPLYSTALAADDLAAILEALRVPRIALYGNSYGTYFAQVFALRHPQLLRALVLDGAYPLDGPDYPWYPHYAPAMREKFNLACERDPSCRALGGSSLEHVAPVLQSLRQAPFEASVSYGNHRIGHLRADASALAIVMFGSAPALASVRELDASARAFVSGDRLPLLRLMAETRAGVDSRDASQSPQKFSAGLAAAVFCQDPPQIFDMSLPVAQRLAERAALIARRRREAPDTYAPFSIDEYRGMPLDYAFIDECVRWPAVTAPPLPAAGVRYPDIPVLVVSGEFDNMTSMADGAAAAGRYPRAQHLVIANSLHVNALPRARSDCGARVVRHFLETLSPGDESCAAQVAPVRLVPRFVRSVDKLDAARAAADNRAGAAALRAVSATLLTCEDAISRAADNGAGSGVGLRGGSFTALEAGEGYKLTLSELRWTPDLAVSGRIEWPGHSGVVRGELTLRGVQSGTLAVSWPEGVAGARASAHGVLGGATVSAEAPAP
jgi:pimeloyl-ACP methyl ester carboxylesterase